MKKTMSWTLAPLSGAVALALFLGPNVAAAEYDSIQVGNLAIGGALRANYTVGDYEGDRRDWDKGGDFLLDTARINLDYENGPWLGKMEYRWYNDAASSYNMLHTGWVGYRFENENQLEVGVTRAPFGPGAYGVSQSWFFDQHYYVGLSDNMNLGVKYTMPMGDWTWDVGYFYSDAGSYSGNNSDDSARYSYDVVDETGTGFEERNQVNFRGIYNIPNTEHEVGFSAQYGELKSNGPQSDGDMFAVSGHAVNRFGNWTLASQLSYYKYDVEEHDLLDVGGEVFRSDKLVQFGAYDYWNEVAAEAWIPAVSASYYHETPNIPWLDYVIPYAEYSSVVKRESDFNNSDLLVLGAAWARGNWYIYTDLAYSNGNGFVGGDTPYGEQLGANTTDDWETRININFGYYF
ncbi:MULTISPECIES: hypothetical protein [Thioalkalivibrio]|uniref:Phosphate-selective porin O and P n=1 Tax=Thioalkalivibrio versutus TaxID=106634 RepID=A0A0G3GBY8_9GAMM|nr:MULTISPECIES: hypothetical protein [Thioalkalivibrio]AKJ96361.1 hypothetical protein TVD_13750 [Thioalkalivibrio versutus]